MKVQIQVLCLQKEESQTRFQKVTFGLSQCKYMYMSYQLWLLQARVKTVEAEDLKIKYSPLTVTKKMKITFRMMFCN